MNGWWFDPRHSGSGFRIDLEDGVWKGAFFGNTAEGKSVWFIGSGESPERIDLYATEGFGFPTTSAKPRKVGSLSVEAVGETLDVTLKVIQKEMVGVDFSPVPPDDYEVSQKYSCVRL